MPLLRQSKLRPRPAKILKWEGIIVDPIGVLLAVLAFEIITFITGRSSSGTALILFFVVVILAVVIGWVCGKFFAWFYDYVFVSEYFTSSVFFNTIIFCFMYFY